MPFWNLFQDNDTNCKVHSIPLLNLTKLIFCTFAEYSILIGNRYLCYMVVTNINILKSYFLYSVNFKVFKNNNENTVKVSPLD